MACWCGWWHGAPQHHLPDGAAADRCLCIATAVLASNPQAHSYTTAAGGRCRQVQTGRVVRRVWRTVPSAQLAASCPQEHQIALAGCDVLQPHPNCASCACKGGNLPLTRTRQGAPTCGSLFGLSLGAGRQVELGVLMMCA